MKARAVFGWSLCLAGLVAHLITVTAKPDIIDDTLVYAPSYYVWQIVASLAFLAAYVVYLHILNGWYWLLLWMQGTAVVGNIIVRPMNDGLFIVAMWVAAICFGGYLVYAVRERFTRGHAT